MKTLLNISLYAYFILTVCDYPLLAQPGHSSQSSESYQSINDSQSMQTYAENGNSNQNSEEQINKVHEKNEKSDSIQKKGFKISRTIDLKGEIDKKEIIVPISEKETELNININIVITEGELFVEIYDPTGDKIGNCSLNCSDSRLQNNKSNDIKNIESASCSLSKSFNPPLPGNWKIVIRYEKARGTLKIEVN